jgi:hypothetical protein
MAEDFITAACGLEPKRPPSFTGRKWQILYLVMTPEYRAYNDKMKDYEDRREAWQKCVKRAQADYAQIAKVEATGTRSGDAWLDFAGDLGEAGIGLAGAYLGGGVPPTGTWGTTTGGAGGAADGGKGTDQGGATEGTSTAVKVGVAAAGAAILSKLLGWW